MGLRSSKIDRAQEAALLRQFVNTNSKDSAQQTLLNGLEDVKSIVGGNDYETAPATLLAKFRDALSSFRTTPDNKIAAQGAITAAQDLANSLNNSTAAVQQVRASADKSISNSVANSTRFCPSSKLRTTRSRMRSTRMPILRLRLTNGTAF